MGVMTEMHQARPHAGPWFRGWGTWALWLFMCVCGYVRRLIHVRARRRQGAAWYPFFRPWVTGACALGNWSGGLLLVPG